MEKMKVFLCPVGEGRLLNTKYSEKQILNSLDYVKTLDEINKVKRGKKKHAIAEVSREKAFIIKRLLKKQGYDVEIQGIWEMSNS